MRNSEDVEGKLQQLQLFEQNLQGFMLQKQALEMQLAEIASALSELQGVKSAYRIIGNVMISSSRDALQADLESRRETSELRIKTLEKQELLIRERAEKLQKEVLSAIKDAKED